MNGVFSKTSKQNTQGETKIENSVGVDVRNIYPAEWRGWWPCVLVVLLLIGTATFWCGYEYGKARQRVYYVSEKRIVHNRTCRYWKELDRDCEYCKGRNH